MAKAVLVMDMPESCIGCNFLYFDGDTMLDSCKAYEVAKPVDSETYEKPDWCPLRELPEKKTSFSDEMEKEKVSGRFDGETGSEYANLVGKITGWNACLDEILK